MRLVAIAHIDHQQIINIVEQQTKNVIVIYIICGISVLTMILCILQCAGL